ncbi:MAG: hypothetical protein ABSC32_20230, partial [Steroidobacteraceae bacterium]
YFCSEQNGLCIQQVIEVNGIFAHDFANKVPALLARKSRVPPFSRRTPKSELEHIGMPAMKRPFAACGKLRPMFMELSRMAGSA